MHGPRVDDPLDRARPARRPGRSRGAATRAGRWRGRRCRCENQQPYSMASVEQLVGRVEPLGPAVDLDRRVELGARREHVVGVERRLADACRSSRARCSGRGCRRAGWRRPAPSARSSAGAPSRSFEWTLATTTSSRASRSSSRSSAPSSRMSTSMPVRIRNGAQLLVEARRSRRAASSSRSPVRGRGRSSGGASGRSAPGTRGRASRPSRAIASIDAPPSLHVEWRVAVAPQRGADRGALAA